MCKFLKTRTENSEFSRSTPVLKGCCAVDFVELNKTFQKVLVNLFIFKVSMQFYNLMLNNIL